MAAVSGQPGRVVLLVDLHPFLPGEESGEGYASVLVSSIRTLLTLSSVSSCLFSLKLFFSSLSPFISESITHKLLGRHSFLSFDTPSQILQSLLKALSLIRPHLSFSRNPQLCNPCALSVVGSLSQVIHEYPWEVVSWDPSSTFSDIVCVHSNLVILFSPLPRHIQALSKYMEADLMENITSQETIANTFSSINNKLIKRDIHVCWVDVNFDHADISAGNDSSASVFRLFGDYVRSVGWSLCSTDAIIIGSTLVPFGLIYPQISCSIGHLSDAYHAEFSVSILDINQKPMTCKYDIQVFIRSGAKYHSFWSMGPMKIQICEIRKKADGPEFKAQCVSYYTLLRRLPCESDSNGNHCNSSHIFASKVLQILSTYEGDFIASEPCWQLLLNFLYQEQCSAMVTISNADGKHANGIIQPFTIHYACLYIIDNDIEVCRTSENHKDPNSGALIDDQIATSPVAAKRKRKRNKIPSVLSNNLSWRMYRQIVIGRHESLNNYWGLELNLETIYLCQECHTSKKLRFLKCWMKQTRRYLQYNQKPLRTSLGDKMFANAGQENNKNSGDGFQQKLFKSNSLSTCPTTCSKTECALQSLDSFLGTPKLFFEDVFQKVQEYFDLNQVELGPLAERLVDACISWVSEKYEFDNRTEAPEMALSTLATYLVVLERHLLKKPRDLATINKGHKWEQNVREHEFQILLRMEILQSKVGADIDEAGKLNLVKEICMLMENIEFYLQQSMLYGESLVEFAGRIIKSRYKHSLPNIIHKIYTEMEFLYEDEEDTPISLNQGNKCEEYLQQSEDEKPDITKVMGIPPSESDLCKRDGVVQKIERERGLECKLKEAQIRRERARRYASFTSWVPSLQRVWAPKRQEKSLPRAQATKRSLKRLPEAAHMKVVQETPVGVAIKPAEKFSQTVGNGSQECKRSKRVLFH